MDLTNQLSDYYRIDPDTFEATLIGGSDEIFYADLAYAPQPGLYAGRLWPLCVDDR